MKLAATLRRLTVDNGDPRSFASRMRRLRYERMSRLLNLQKHDRLLDIGAGGGAGLEFFNRTNRIITLNLTREEARTMQAYPNTLPLVGDGCALPFRDLTVDLVFSNSVLEHVGSLKNVEQFAAEHCRVGRRYYLQTPNRHFPLEPHYLFPFFQFLPETIQRRIHRVWRVSWFYGRPFERVLLQSKRDLEALFPRGTIVSERLFGLTKSWMVIGANDDQQR